MATVTRLLEESGLSPSYGTRVHSAAALELEDPVNAALLCDWLRSLQCTHLVFGSSLDPSSAQAHHTRLLAFLERHHLLHCPYAQLRRVAFVGSAAACARISSLGGAQTACISADDSQLEMLSQLGFESSSLPVSMKGHVAYDKSRSDFGREVVLDQSYLHEELALLNGGRVLRNGASVVLCRGNSPEPLYWESSSSGDGDRTRRSGLVRYLWRAEDEPFASLAGVLGSARQASERGAHTFVLETEVNPLSRVWGVNELARLRAARVLLNGSHGFNGELLFHLRVGARHRLTGSWKEEISLAASAALMSDLAPMDPDCPHIIEIFHQSHGSSLLHPEKIEDSARLVLHSFRKHARLRARGEMPDMSVDRQVLARTSELIARVGEKFGASSSYRVGGGEAVDFSMS